MTQSSAIPDSWKEWLLQNLKRGCAVDQLIQKAQANGFERAAIEAVLANSQHSLSRAPSRGSVMTPVKGLALAWKYLLADGNPNALTLHESMSVVEGNQWVITKWFRAEMGRNG